MKSLSYQTREGTSRRPAGREPLFSRRGRSILLFPWARRRASIRPDGWGLSFTTPSLETQTAASATPGTLTHAATIYFPDREALQGLRQEGSAQEHLAVVLPGGQDRGHRGERVGEEYAAPHHGGDRYRLRRDRAARDGDHDRVCAAGADARPQPGRPG